MKENNFLLVLGCGVILSLLSFSCTSDKDSGSWDIAEWKELPEGIVFLKVEGLYEDQQVIGQAGEKLFRKAAPFIGPYGPPASDCTSGVIRNMGYSEKYSNLERGKPLAFAVILLRHPGEEPGYIALAEELIRFAEDQVIVWEQALPKELFGISWSPIPRKAYLTSKWFTPCA